MQTENSSSSHKRTTKRDLVIRIADETGLIQQDVHEVIQKPWTTLPRVWRKAKM